MYLAFLFCFLTLQYIVKIITQEYVRVFPYLGWGSHSIMSFRYISLFHKFLYIDIKVAGLKSIFEIDFFFLLLSLRSLVFRNLCPQHHILFYEISSLIELRMIFFILKKECIRTYPRIEQSKECLQSYLNIFNFLIVKYIQYIESSKET